MPTYAADTSVSSDRSIAEIRRILQRWHADQFAYAETPDKAMVGFTVCGRQVRLVVLMPARDAKEFKWTNHAAPRRRTVNQQLEAWEQAVRQRWRALALLVKAKLEAVEAGISTFENEFLANILLPGNVTVGDAVRDDIAHAYETNTVPELLPGLKAIEAPSG